MDSRVREIIDNSQKVVFLEEQVFPPKAISRISVPKQGCTTP